MKTIFITGTAGSGKSLLTLNLSEWYKSNNALTVTLNLDPAVINLPYEPDIDIRNYIDIYKIMEKYELGPNGAIVMANDLIDTLISDIQSEVDKLGPDYVIVDTPGQIELFAFRSSGPYFVSNFNSENKVVIFLYDGALVSSAINFISLSLLATSIQLRLKKPQINVLTKRDLILTNLEKILKWSSSSSEIEDALNEEKNYEYSILSREIIKSLENGELIDTPIAISNTTLSGMVNLYAALSRILNIGEDKEQ